MNNIPDELKYVDSHEWLRVEADGRVVVGITDHAQELLGDIVFVELPEVGSAFVAGEQAGVVESVKAASDVYVPVSGTVVAVNEALVAAPEMANSDPYGDGWFFCLEAANAEEMAGLLSAQAYADLVGE